MDFPPQIIPDFFFVLSCTTATIQEVNLSIHVQKKLFRNCNNYMIVTAPDGTISVFVKEIIHDRKRENIQKKKAFTLT